jgi:phosphohistidine phosphatase
MKRLSLLRHAKSGWDDPAERDFDRPLNSRGWRAARRMGQWLGEQQLAFDHVMASPAVRIRQTLEGLEEGLGHPIACAFDRRIYMASAAILFDLVQDTSDGIDHLLLIGHNPGLEDLCLDASSGHANAHRDRIEEKYPTAAFASLEFAIDRWADAGEGGAVVTRFMRPRDLDASLGPED